MEQVMIKQGDTFTVAGYYEQVPNPDRLWWQFWKPKLVQSGKLIRFTVTASRKVQ